MFKQIISIINSLFLLGKSPEMSKQWRAEQLSDYEHETNLKAGLY
jgi:hypothetical protein